MKLIQCEFEASLESIDPPVAVAVSGGADSLALLLSAHQWAQKKGGRVVALTVDHGLRVASAAETLQVKTWASERGIEHVTLGWSGEKPTSRLQEKAREMRYHLLTSWCKAHTIPTLLLGHHANDQEETFWLRLASGSGLDGLSGMHKRRVREGILIVRPFLGLPKDQLKKFLASEHQDWIDDPSNESPRFFRGRLRPVLQEEGLSSTRLVKTMEKLQEDSDFIQKSLQKALATTVEQHKGGYLSLHRQAFDALHPALSQRLLSLCMRWFSKDIYPPRSQQIQGILKKLRANSPFTAGGIYWFHQHGKIYLIRELSVIESPLFLKDVHEKTLWDQRIWVDPEIKKNLPKDAYVGPLGASMRQELHTSKMPRRLWPTLPAIWVKEEVVAIPHLCYTPSACEKDLEKYISFKPLFNHSLRDTT